jgi:flagellar hook-associated protein 3 FlgL
MRVTQNMMSNLFVSNLRKQVGQMLERQEQVATQRRLNRPSDDPAGMVRVLDGRSTLAAIEQYSENIKQGMTRLETQEEILKLVNDLVQQARGLAEENGGGEISAGQRALAATRVREIYDQVLQLANSRHGGRYLFSGHQTARAPFSEVDYTATYNGDAGSFRVPIAEGIEVSLDADGRSYFQGAGAAGGVDIFAQLKELIEGLDGSDSARIRATVDPLETAHAQIMNKRTEASPKLYRLQATGQHWTNLKARVQEAVGREEDADLAQAIVELKNLETAYQATMATAARIMQSGLASFLR